LHPQTSQDGALDDCEVVGVAVPELSLRKSPPKVLSIKSDTMRREITI